MDDNPVYCRKCGTESFVGAHFCTRCGSQLEPTHTADEATEHGAASSAVLPSARTTQDSELTDIDLNFDALVGAAGDHAKSAEAQSHTDNSLKTLAQEDLRPIRDFMIELEIGAARQDSIPGCRTAIERLTVSARAIGLAEELFAALGEMAASFARLHEAYGDRIADEGLVLRRAYAALIEQLSGDASANAELARRERAVHYEPSSGTPDASYEVDSVRTLGEGPTSAQDRASSEPVNEQGEREYMMNKEDRPNEKRTIVEEGSHLKGTLVSSCPVDVRGRVEGELETPSLTVAPSGAVQGRARVGSVCSEGELAGEFDADTVQLSGVVRDNTVIRAREMQVRLASQRGKLQVIFGECEQPVVEAQAPAAEKPSEATAPMPQSFEQSHDAEAGPAIGGETLADSEQMTSDDNGSQRARRRHAQRGPRHSEPPPAIS